MAFNALIVLDGNTLTDDGRTFSTDRDERAVEIELAGGNVKKYIKSEKKIWQLDWDWLPSLDANTSDNNSARNTIRTIAMAGDPIILNIQYPGGTENHTVFVDDYDEEVLRRDPVQNETFYNVSLTLKEV